MPKIKLNINNSKKAENSSEKELIERARMQIEEKRMSSDTIPQKTKSKIGLFVFISAALIIAASAATFVVVNKNNQQPYKKFIPKSTIISASLSPEKLNTLFNAPNPLIFPYAISKIKTEATVLGADTEKILSRIKKDIIIASVKTLDNSLSSIIIVQLPENFERQSLENKMRQNFNVSYQNYRGERMINVKPLELKNRKESFWYAVVGNSLLISQDVDTLKLSIDAGK